MDTDVTFPVTLKSTVFVPTTVPEAICWPFTSIEYVSFSEDCSVATQCGYMSPPEIPGLSVRNWSWPGYDDDTDTDSITWCDNGPMIVSLKAYVTPWNTRDAFAVLPDGPGNVYEKSKVPKDTPVSIVVPFDENVKLPLP